MKGGDVSGVVPWGGLPPPCSAVLSVAQHLLPSWPVRQRKAGLGAPSLPPNHRRDGRGFLA